MYMYIGSNKIRRIERGGGVVASHDNPFSTIPSGKDGCSR